MNNNAYGLELPEEYEVNVTFNVTNFIPFARGTDDEANPSDLRSNPSQDGGDDDIPLAKGPTTREMAKRIQEG